MSDFLFTIYYFTDFITSHNIQNNAYLKRHKHAKVEKNQKNTTNNQVQQYLIKLFYSVNSDERELLHIK